MKRSIPLLALLGLFLVSGCIESTTLLEVNRDGSGKVVVRECMSPQITNMMEGMGGMFAGMGEEGAAAAQPAEKPDIFADMIEGNIDKFGGKVELVESKKITNKKGWKGYKATYAFDDINDLTISIGDSDKEEGPAAPGGGGEKEKNNPEYTFEFAGGDPAVLKIIPARAEEPAVDAAMEEAGAEADAMGEAMGNAMMEGMGAMMGPMLKGMRMSFIVRVGDDIKQTNAAHRSEKYPNVVTVMDMPVDKMMSNPEAMKILQANDKDSLAQLEEMDLDGIKLESPDKTIEIQF